MALVLLVGGVGLLLLPGFTRRLGRRLAPAEWSRLCGAAVVGGACTVELAALFYAAPTVLHAVGAPSLARVCEWALGHPVPDGALAGWSALMAAVAMPAFMVDAALRARRRSRCLWVEPFVGVHRTAAGHELVELPTQRPLALAVPGPSPQIVVSQGMVELLSARELEAVIAHEAAHLDLGHHRLLVAMAGVERGLAFLPLRWSARALRGAVERWADETAAGDTDEARAALRSALLQVTMASVDTSIAAFSAADTVVERLQYLAQPGRSPSVLLRAALYSPGALLGMAVVVTLAAWVFHGHLIMSLAGHCLSS